MWYVSANRDDDIFERAGRVPHRSRQAARSISPSGSASICMGSRLAELQIRVLWEEILRRDLRFEIMGPPKRVYSNFIRGIRSLPVRIMA